MADHKDFAEHGLARPADGNGQRRAPFAAVSGGGAHEITLAGAQGAGDGFACGHRQVARSHLAPSVTVVFACGAQRIRCVPVAGDARDTLAIHDDSGLAPHFLQVLRLRDRHHIPLGEIFAVTDRNDGRVARADFQPGHDPIAIFHLLRLLHGPEPAFDHGALRLPLPRGFIEHIGPCMNALHRAGVGAMKCPERAVMRKECAVAHSDRAIA